MKIGLDVGGSHIGVGIINEKNEIVLKKEKDIKISESDNPKETLLNSIIVLLNEMKLDQIESIGIACPGTIRNGKIIRAENLNICESDKDAGISKSLEDIFHTKVTIRNDAKCAGIAEKKLGSLKNYNDAIFLTLGTGIGGAVFLDGKLLEPKKNCGFEIGHMVIDINGEKCTCGRNGCFETLASMRKLKSDIKEKLKLDKETTGIEIQNLLEDEFVYKSVEDIIDRYIYSLGIGIANLINLFEPEVISIGGSFAHYNKFLMDKLQKELRKENAIFNKGSVPKLVIAELKNDAGIIGAVL